MAATSLPTGTVTFLLTDIEGSTQLWEQHPEAMDAALARHDALAAALIAEHQGTLVKHRGEGDSLFAVFARAADAVAAGTALQRSFHAEPWPSSLPLRVRMALHTGDATLREGDYFGLAVNRCARLRAAAHGGQVLLSAVTQELVQDTLPPGVSLRDLGRHRLRDLQRPETIIQLLHADLPADFPPLASLDALPHNLPQQVTSFIGREIEMAEVRRLLGTTRLLTVTGAGGTGKTRLALQTAADLLPEYTDGAWLVELAPLTDPALLPQSVASVLGVREQPGTSLTQTLVAALQGKRLLLVLDNCEHLLPACAALADALLRGCPAVQLLATSREGLTIPGETTYRLQPLSLPDPEHLPPTLDSLTQYASVRLFIDRATAAVPAFTVTNQNAPAVAGICQRLDGIPLAIELAAARVRALPVEKVHERLDDRFRLLTGGSRLALPRQQTLRALIDWSYDLLIEPERAVLRRLSVFAGGWTLEAAEAVCAGDGVDEREVLDLLTSLVDKSLVQYEEKAEEGRYRLLETVRQYAGDRLLEAGEAEGGQRRHLAFLLRWAEQEVPLDRAEREQDNLRAVLLWGLESDPEAALQLAVTLVYFWWMRGYYAEGRETLERGLQRAGEATTEVRAMAFRGLGAFAEDQGHFDTAKGHFETCLELFRALDDKWHIAEIIGRLAGLAMAGGDYLAARAGFEQSLALSREIGAPRGIVWNLGNLGKLGLAQGQYEEARDWSEQSLAIRRQNGDKVGMAGMLRILGKVAEAQGDYEKARRHHAEHLTISREIKVPRNIAAALVDLAGVAIVQGQHEEAHTLLTEGLAISREIGETRYIGHGLQAFGELFAALGDPHRAREFLQESLAAKRRHGHRLDMPEGLEGLAGLAAAAGDARRAARLLGAAEALRAEIGRPLPPASSERHERHVAVARAALGEQEFTAAWAEGRALSLEEAVKFALEEGNQP